MVGNKVIKIADRTSIVVASKGVATIGKPRPKVPCISPANPTERMTISIVVNGRSNNENKIFKGIGEVDYVAYPAFV